ncbi:hypothetical protein, partial [Legionella tunisiensis]|uniref:hypothetical protein n=1 Tax=Legionella tunisiensis TaxID=1034944 RepID=UPI001E5793AC
ATEPVNLPLLCLLESSWRSWGKTRNLFAIAVGRYTNSAAKQRALFQNAKEIWQSAATELLCA